MINETGGLKSAIDSERLYRENSATETSRRQSAGDQDVNQESSGADTVSLSAEAIARFRNVPPTAAASELQESPADESGTEDTGEPQRFGTIDIRV